MFIFAPNLATPGAIDVSMPDGKRWRTHVLGIAVFDRATQASTLLAEVQDSIGELHPPNVIIYPDAFATATGAKGTVRFTNALDHIEQDVLWFNRLELPPGYAEASSQLEIWTEAVAFEEPEKIERQVNGQTDQTLVFGATRIGEGRAVTLEDPQGRTWSAPMYKQWIKTEAGRTFLVEACPWLSIKNQLNAPPPPGQGAAIKRVQPANQVAEVGTSRRDVPARAAAGGITAGLGKGGPTVARLDAPRTASRYTGTPTTPPRRLFPAPPKPTQTGKIQTASLPMPSKGLVWDYSVVVTASGVLWKGNETYFIASSCTISGSSNVLEGGAVLKSSNGVTLTIAGSLETRTDPYRPAILTSWCDNTVGETIAASTGNPATNAAGSALYMNTSAALSDLSHLRISYASCALNFNTGRGHQAKHIQIVHCTNAFQGYSASFDVRNVLAYDCATLFNCVPNATSRVEQATFDIAGTMNLNSNCVLFLTNCLLVAVTNTSPYTGANNASNSDPDAVFQTIGAGAHYLLDNTYRNLGTTNINSTLLAELRQRTTYPPRVLNSIISAETTIGPEAQRDVDTPDLGFHYAPLDVVCNGAYLYNGGNLTALPGTAIGVRADRNTSGLKVFDRSKFVCGGTPTLLNRFVRYNTVQEQANSNWTGSGPGLSLGAITGTPWAQVRFRFTEFSVTANDSAHFDDVFTVGTNAMADCQLYGGRVTAWRGDLGATNCLFHRVATTLDDYDVGSPFGAEFRNSLFYGGNLDVSLFESSTWKFKDNVFDNTLILTNTGTTNGYNAYTTNLSRLS